MAADDVNVGSSCAEMELLLLHQVIDPAEVLVYHVAASDLDTSHRRKISKSVANAAVAPAEKVDSKLDTSRLVSHDHYPTLAVADVTKDDAADMHSKPNTKVSKEAQVHDAVEKMEARTLTESRIGSHLGTPRTAAAPMPLDCAVNPPDATGCSAASSSIDPSHLPQ